MGGRGERLQDMTFRPLQIQVYLLQNLLCRTSLSHLLEAHSSWNQEITLRTSAGTKAQYPGVPQSPPQMSANAVASDEETGERQTTPHEASARTISPPTNLWRTDTLRRAFISLCLVDLVTVIAIGAFMVQQWRGPPWNAPIWPMIPLLLNRSIEVAALCLKNVFTSITTSAVQVFLAVINLILCTQRMPCENSIKTCIGSILAVSILVLEILIAVIVTLWINWAHFMSWASAGSHEMMLAAQGLAGREHSAGVGVGILGPGQAGRRARGTPKKFIQVEQPGEDSCALAIVVDATGRAGDAPRFPVGKEAEGAPQQHDA